MQRFLRSDSGSRRDSGSASVWLRLTGLFAVVVLVGGCASRPQVTRTSSDEMIDVSGYWNDTDSQLVSIEMVDTN